MSKAEQQARELAERVKPPFEFEAQFDTQAEINAYALGFGEGKESTLREINLTALLEDKAILDFANAMQRDVIWMHFSKKWHVEGFTVGKWDANLRTAITNAMKEETK